MNVQVNPRELQRLPANVRQVVETLQRLPEDQRREYLASLPPETRRQMVAAMFSPRAGQVAWAGGKGAAVGAIVGYVWKDKPGLGALTGAGIGVALHLGIRCCLKCLFTWGLEKMVTSGGTPPA